MLFGRNGYVLDFSGSKYDVFTDSSISFPKKYQRHMSAFTAYRGKTF